MFKQGNAITNRLPLMAFTFLLIVFYITIAPAIGAKSSNSSASAARRLFCQCEVQPEVYGVWKNNDPNTGVCLITSCVP
jgi:hypothetical protein